MLTENKEPRFLHTLAAASAAAEDFDVAVKWSEKSLEVLGDAGNPQLREYFLRALADFKGKKAAQEINAKDPAKRSSNASNEQAPADSQLKDTTTDGT